ncbi:MAG: hypothetical protein WCA09_16980 [Burkholderiales bacterium]
MIAPAPTQMIKYAFRIRTRSGTPVDNLVVQGRDQAEAERKINQIYPGCEVLECRHVHAAIGDDAVNLESIISLIAREPEDERGSGG